MIIALIDKLRSGRVRGYLLFLLTCLVYTAEADGTNYYSLSVSEVNLLADSTDASNWSDYGWALWELGDPKADWAFGRALYLDSGCQESRRGLASIESVKGEYSTALDYLAESVPSDTLSIVMKTAILQNTGNLLESDEILSEMADSGAGSYSGLFSFLRLRQSRLTVTPPDGVQEDPEYLSDSCCPSGLRQLVKLELILQGNTEDVMSSGDVLEAMSFDRLFFGGVYQDIPLSDICSSSSSEIILPARIVFLTGDPAGAFELLTDYDSSSFSLQDKVWTAEILIQLDKLDSAMELVDEVIQADSSFTDAWRLKGLLLLRSYQYYEAFETMQSALAKTDRAYECSVFAGIAAELAGEVKLAVECYAPVLAASSDSIVLINRERELVLNKDLNYNFAYEERETFQTTDRSWLNGSLLMTYSGSTGEVEQNQFSFAANAFHEYGMFGSNISASIKYSLEKWPGSSGRQEIGSASVCVLHSFSSRFYGSVEAALEQRRYDVNRWKLEISSSAGRWFQPVTPLVLDIDAGIGRTVNKWDIEGNYTTDWIALASLSTTLKGQMIANYLPSIHASIDFQQQLDNLSRYDIWGNLNISYYPASFLSVGAGWSTEYLSAIPPDYRDIHNSSTFLQVGYSF